MTACVLGAWFKDLILVRDKREMFIIDMNKADPEPCQQEHVKCLVLSLSAFYISLAIYRWNRDVIIPTLSPEYSIFMYINPLEYYCLHHVQ